MTRRDFEVVAEIVAVIGDERREVLLAQAGVACEYLKTTNADFDENRFVGTVIAKRGRIEQELARHS